MADRQEVSMSFYIYFGEVSFEPLFWVLGVLAFYGYLRVIKSFMKQIKKAEEKS